MKIINLTPNESGAYSAIQEGTFSRCPTGYAIVPNDFDTAVFYECGGFVSINVENGIVTQMVGNYDAWSAWQEEHPKPDEPSDEPTDDGSGAVIWDELAAAYREGVNSIG